jgi:hypothetical protein
MVICGPTIGGLPVPEAPLEALRREMEHWRRLASSY